jgi:multiple sugar transport system ATP-binding protein
VADVKFVRVTKRFGKVLAVNDLNLEVADKEFMTMVGPSGCGKSTTLNLLAGLEDPDEGEIHIGDRVVNDVPPGDRNIAMVFQSYALYPHMKVFDNMAFGLEMQKTPQPEIRRRVREAADLLEIGDLLERKPAQLSGGQRQRVALGRAIVRAPDVFLLDEPLSNLDAILRVQMRADLRLLFNRLGSTVVYVTHDQAEAMTMSDRLAVFRLGVVQQVGTPIEVYRRPINVFVARFIGSPPMTFVPGRIESEADGGCFTARGMAVPLPGPLPADWPKDVIAGLRPEDLTLRPAGEGIAGQVELVEQLGAESIVYVSTGGHMITVKIDKETQVQRGQNVGLVVPAAAVHYFDARSERRLPAASELAPGLRSEHA